MASQRAYDVVLLGATGFVGQLTAAELARTAPQVTRVALAGRSADRLAAVRDDLPAAARDWPLEVVDATDDTALRRLAARTNVLVSTVGPYAPHGLPVVEACADLGTDYADLTGETLFVRRSIDTAHTVAERTGARIVHSCGFDSVPSDLGVGLAAGWAAADDAGSLTDTLLHVRSMRGGISGGTVDSLRQQLIETGGDRSLRRLASDPAALADGYRGPRAPHRFFERDPDTGRWQVPFVMGGYNRQIVLRSASLTEGGYGPGFTYREVVDTGTGPRGLLSATAVLAGTGGLVGGLAFPPTRRLLGVALPKTGQGPSEPTMQRGRFHVEIDAGTTSGVRYRTTVAASLDPGYRGTAVMLAASALCLALDPLPRVGGVRTPMTALGEALTARLRARGFTVSTERIGR